jgi:transposase
MIDTQRMEITAKQFSRIELHLPKQRGNVSHENLKVINAILYVAESGCKWRALPKQFGNWHTIYTRMNRWAKAGVLERVFAELQREHLIHIKIGAVILDRTIAGVNVDGTGARKLAALKRSVIPKGGTSRKFLRLSRVLYAT